MADTTGPLVWHLYPDVLPGSRLVLFTRALESQYLAETRDIAVANVETGEVTVLLQGIQAIWSNTGHILVVRGNGTLMAAPFDPSTLEVGPTTPVFEGLEVDALVTAESYSTRRRSASSWRRRSFRGQPSSSVSGQRCSSLGEC